MKRLLILLICLFLLTACAAEEESLPEPVPEPEPVEISIPEPEPVEEPAIETETEMDWAYAQAAAFIRDSLRSCGREEDVTVYFAPWESYGTYPRDPEDVTRWHADAAVELPSGVMLWAPVSCAWNRENGFIDPFVDFHFLLHPDCTNYYSASSRQLAAGPEAVLSTTGLDVTPCYDPPAPLNFRFWGLREGAYLRSEPLYIPDSLVEKVRRCILTHDEPLEALLWLETGRTVSPEAAALEAPQLSDDAASRMRVDWETCQYVTAVDFDNDGIEDRYAGSFGPGWDGLRLYLFCAGQPDGSFVVNYYEEAYSGYLWFLDWEGQTYCVDTAWDYFGLSSAPPSSIILTRMEHGQALEKAVFRIYLGPEALVREYDEDGRLLAPDLPPPSEREIDLEIYTRGVNTDFPLPDR